MNSAIKSIWMGFLNQIMAYLCGRLWEIAKQWAAIYEADDRAGLSGAEKRAHVAAMIREEARAIGVTIAESLINLAVEAAVQYIRSLAG